jgi:hypothetical protein
MRCPNPTEPEEYSIKHCLIISALKALASERHLSLNKPDSKEYGTGPIPNVFKKR